MDQEHFQFTFSNGVSFTEDREGKIKCGRCNKPFSRIVSHLQNNKEEGECGSKLEINLLKSALDSLKQKRMGH